MDRVSISPSLRSSLCICRAIQASGTRPFSCKNPKISCNNAACSARLMPRKSGMRQTSQSRRTEAGSLARAAISASCANNLSAARSSASRARTRRSWSGFCSRDAISAGSDPKRIPACLQFTLPIGENRCPVMARATSSSSGGASPVTPKLPLLIPRPARPAIWASSLGARGRIRRPSNLLSAENAT